MITQNDIEQMMEDIEKEDGNVIFLDEIYKEPEVPVPDFFSIMKQVCFGWLK